MKTPLASGHLNRRTALTALVGLPVLAGTILPALAQTQTSLAAPLASWNESASKQAITDFVGRVTKQGGPDYVDPAERIAVFDNDGTLWTEHPMYVQLAFALDRVKAMAPLHPEWNNKQPFKAVLDGDLKALAASGERGMMELVMVTHAGMTSAEFTGIVSQWLATAQHPRFKRPYIELVYQPMIELLGYLRANGFKTFIVSGGGVEFMRPWADRVYGIPPEQVVGSAGKLKLEVRDGKPVLVKLPEIDRAGSRFTARISSSSRPSC